MLSRILGIDATDTVYITNADEKTERDFRLKDNMMCGIVQQYFHLRLLRVVLKPFLVPHTDRCLSAVFSLFI